MKLPWFTVLTILGLVLFYFLNELGYRLLAAIVLGGGGVLGLLIEARREDVDIPDSLQSTDQPKT